MADSGHVGTVLDPMTFKLLVEDGADAMFIVCHDRPGLAYVNPALVALLGYDDASELIGRDATEAVIHPIDHPLIHRIAADARAGEIRREPVPVRWRRKDGSAIAVVGGASQIVYAGSPATLVIARRDTHLRALQLAEERSRLLFDRAPVPIFVFDRETHDFLAVNQAMVDLYGYAQDELLAMRLDDIKLVEDAAEIGTTIDTIVATQRFHVGLVRHRTKSGRYLDVDITSHVIDFDGRAALMSIGIDVTEARKLEQELRHAQKMDAVGQLAGGVAHDFNNLLGVISANVELALEDIASPELLLEELREIEGAAERATALTRQLLAFSRKQPHRSEPLALARVVASCEKMLSRIVGEDIEMTTVLAPELATIRADAGQLEQILVNLVVNARDAMPTGGLLIVEARNVEVTRERASRHGINAGPYVELSVRDTGCGMDETTRARVYEPFFTTKPVGKGTGLGLSTVFGIVEQSSGAIELESEHLRGTTFRILFPAIARVESSIVVATEARLPARRNESVLLVEDDAPLRNGIRRHLNQLGYRTHVAASAHAGLELLQQPDLEVDLLLTDLVMPGLDGRSFAVEAMRVRPRLRVVFMSGFTEHVAVKTARFEHDHFVEKPFTSAKLSQVLRRALA